MSWCGGVTWLPLIFFGGQALILISLVLWTIWTDAIKPRLIPTAEIYRTAADIIGNHPHPEEEACARCARAWSRSDGAEHVYWYRC